MEFLAMLYTVLLVAICLMLALLLYRGNKPRRGGGDTEELKQWLAQQLDAQAKAFEQKQAAMAEQNYTAIRSVSETLQTAVQNMSSTLAQGQSGQQQILTQRLQSLEAANTQKLEELRKTLADSMTALQAENTRPDEYDGKVQVVDDHRISVTMRQSALDAKWMADNGKSAKEIKEALEQNAYNSAIYLTVEDLKYLKKGGRVTPAAAALGAVLNIKPVLATKGGKFDAVEKVRGMKKSIAKLLDYTEQTLDKLIEKNNVSQIRIGVAGTFLNQEDADNWYNMVKDRFVDIENIEYDPLSLVVAVHTGPNAAGIGISVILRDE